MNDVGDQRPQSRTEISQSLNTLFIHPVNKELDGIRALAIAVLDMSIRDLLYIYHTGRMQDSDRRLSKHNLKALRTSEPYRFLTEPSVVRDFWCMAAGLDGDAIGEWISFYCSDMTNIEQFSRSFTHKSVGVSRVNKRES